jgi:hypothetical protein
MSTKYLFSLLAWSLLDYSLFASDHGDRTGFSGSTRQISFQIVNSGSCFQTLFHKAFSIVLAVGYPMSSGRSKTETERNNNLLRTSHKMPTKPILVELSLGTMLCSAGSAEVNSFFHHGSKERAHGRFSSVGFDVSPDMCHSEGECCLFLSWFLSLHGSLLFLFLLAHAEKFFESHNRSEIQNILEQSWWK